MNKVKRINNWSCWDELDGVELKNGEKIKVRWPSGKETIETVCVIPLLDESSHFESNPQKLAFVNIVVDNLIAEVKLAQDGILCERVE